MQWACVSYGVFVGVFWGVFSHCEASGSQSFLFSCAFHSADAIKIARALGGAFYTELPRLNGPNWRGMTAVLQNLAGKSP